MSRYIDADALIEFIDSGHYRNPSELCYSEQDVVDMIESRPTVNVREHIRGEWKEIDGDSGIWACPICGWTISLPTGNPQGQRCNFCQYCGSDLRAEGDDRDCFLCVHKKPDGCESWDCHFERKPLEVRNECF